MVVQTSDYEFMTQLQRPIEGSGAARAGDAPKPTAVRNIQSLFETVSQYICSLDSKLTLMARKIPPFAEYIRSMSFDRDQPPSS